MRTPHEVAIRLSRYRNHKCSYDERENGCPICGDIENMENELQWLLEQDAIPEVTKGMPDC